MSIDPQLKPWQILAVALRSEVDAESFYRKLAGRVKNVILIDKLEFLAREESHHKAILERLAGQRYPDRALDAPEDSQMPPIAANLGDNPPVLDLFRAALGAEEKAEAFYNEAGGTAGDEGSRRTLAYLGRVERSHQAMIRSEIELLEKFPDYYNVEDFHIGQDLFHVGP